MDVRSYRTPLLWLSAIRAVIAVAAIPLAPMLYEKHFLVLVLMRPTKEVLLAGGFLAAKGKIHLMQLAAAAVPLAIAGVWHAFALGRLHKHAIADGDLPWLANKVLRPEKVKKISKVLRRRGERLVFLGRLAAFPSTLIGLAAGASKMPVHRFLMADAAGGMLSIILVLGLGYALGGASSSAQTIVTAGGIITLIAFSLILGWYLKKEPEPQPRTKKRRKTSSSKRVSRRTSSGRTQRAKGRMAKRSRTTGARRKSRRRAPSAGGR